ncbi:MAG: alkaline phosphatase family protein [Gemmataceae bacterium]
MPAPLVIINTVGLTTRMLQYAPRLAALAKSGWSVPMREPLPAVTCTSQATMLTGVPPNKHGIVANGWLYRDTNEVRFWQQSNRLIQTEPVYATAKRRAARRGRSFTSAKLFWWFNQGAQVNYSVTPKPYYGIQGSKVFDIATTPPELSNELKNRCGPFPFTKFWGPLSERISSAWITSATAIAAIDRSPDLAMIYIPHLDYNPQRKGPSNCDLKEEVNFLDVFCGDLANTFRALGKRVWLVNEYAHCDVNLPVYLNKVLRNAGLVAVRPGPFGEQLDLFASRAFAACDHQIAHVYVANPADIPRVADLIRGTPGIDRIYVGEERAEIELDHPRSGEIIALAKPDAWFAYPFWLDDRDAPDYARTVAIHHKPGFDPCELFFDPKLRWPKLTVARKLLMSKLGFRTKFDVIPLDASIVRGSHGLAAKEDIDRPVWIGDGPKPGAGAVPMTAVRDAILRALDLEED